MCSASKTLKLAAYCPAHLLSLVRHLHPDHVAGQAFVQAPSAQEEQPNLACKSGFWAKLFKDLWNQRSPFCDLFKSSSNGYQSFRNPASSINDDDEAEPSTSSEKPNSEIFLKINTDPEEHEEEVGFASDTWRLSEMNAEITFDLPVQV